MKWKFIEISFFLSFNLFHGVWNEFIYLWSPIIIFPSIVITHTIRRTNNEQFAKCCQCEWLYIYLFLFLCCFFFLIWNGTIAPHQIQNISTKTHNVNCRFNNDGNDIIATSTACSFMHKMYTFVTLNSVVPWLFIVIVAVFILRFSVVLFIAEALNSSIWRPHELFTHKCHSILL